VLNTVSLAYQVIRKEIKSKKKKYLLENKLKPKTSLTVALIELWSTDRSTSSSNFELSIDFSRPPSRVDRSQSRQNRWFAGRL